MWFLEKLEAEFPGLKRAIVILAALAVGFGGGLLWRGQEVANQQTLIILKDAQLAELQKPTKIDQTKTNDKEADEGQTEAPAFSADKETVEQAIKREKGFEGSISAKQLAALQLTLKAFPSSVEIHRFRNSPNVFASQIQGIFIASGWKIEVKESSATSDYFIVVTIDRKSSDVLAQALGSAGIGYNALDVDQNFGSKFFYLEAPK